MPGDGGKSEDPTGQIDRERKGGRNEDRGYLPLIPKLLASHLKGRRPRTCPAATALRAELCLNSASVACCGSTSCTAAFWSPETPPRTSGPHRRPHGMHPPGAENCLSAADPETLESYECTRKTIPRMND